MEYCVLMTFTLFPTFSLKLSLMGIGGWHSGLVSLFLFSILKLYTSLYWMLLCRNLHVANLPNQMMIYQSAQKKVLQVGLQLKNTSITSYLIYQMFLAFCLSLLLGGWHGSLNVVFHICHIVKPRKGDALLFFSLLPSAIPDPQSLHAGCPVIEGEKWSATKWIHVDSFDKIVGAGGNCIDQNDNCERWAALGECKNNAEYMVGTAELPGACRRSCKLC